jgi:hypothetical protein
MNKNQTTQINEEVKTIVMCENCYQKLRIPRRNRKLRVTCPKCRHGFNYQYYALGFSSSSIKPLLVGLTGGLVGFSVIELVVASQFLSAVNHLLNIIVVIGAFGICLGAVMGAAEGFFKKDMDRLDYGLKDGAKIGLVSGMVSGLIAQFVFSAILSSISLARYTFLWSTAHLNSSLAQIMFARTIGWCVLGLLTGLSYGIKEKTWRGMKSGLMGGTIGGAISGLLFDPLSSAIHIGEGTLGRLIGFSILGMAIGVAAFRFRKVVIRQKRDRHESQCGQRVIYVQFQRRSPTNQSSLPPSSSSQLPPTSDSSPKLPPPAS